MMIAEIYTKPSCPWCTKAKHILKKHGYIITEFIVGVDGVTKETIEKRIQKPVKTVPQILLNNVYIGGCVELMSHLNEK